MKKEFLNQIKFSEDGKKLIAFPREFNGEYTVPEGVKVIGFKAFANCAIRKVSLSKSVRTIEENAFDHSDISRVVFSEGLHRINQQAFAYCKNLTDIKFPKSLHIIEEEAFLSTKLLHITFPERVKKLKLGNSAFYGSQIKAITLPEGLKTLTLDTFDHCEKLRTIVLPKSIMEISVDGPVFCHAKIKLTK